MTAKSKKRRDRKKPESTMFVRLGKYLKRERELKGLTQGQIEEAIGLAASRISAIEVRGGNPGLANLGRWLQAMEIGPASFGWRYERFCNDQPLAPLQSEAHVKDIVRGTLVEVLQELTDIAREREMKRAETAAKTEPEIEPKIEPKIEPETGEEKKSGGG